MMEGLNMLFGTMPLLLTSTSLSSSISLLFASKSYHSVAIEGEERSYPCYVDHNTAGSQGRSDACFQPL